MNNDAWNEVVQFWFHEIEMKSWFVKDLDFDQTIIERFSALHQSVAAGESWVWRDQPMGRVAEIIVLDQFSRNMFRGTPRSFAYDGMALVLAQEAIALGIDQHIDTAARQFCYMPFMHSESLRIHEQALVLYASEGLENSLDFEKKHQVILQQFGRYPHRNEILGRESTEQEIAFLQQPGSSF